MSDLVTGEAVALEMRLARFPSRVLAIGVDLFVLAVVAIVLFVAAGAVIPALDPALAATLSLVTVVAIFVGVPVIVETLTRGRSLGKLVMGLRVVRDDGGPVRFRHALARGLAGFFVDFYVTLGVGAVVCSLLNDRGKRVGDLIAGTVVIRERAPSAGAPLPPVPPQLAGWATGLELSRLPDDLALTARRYLARSHELSPRVREEMGAQLATEVARVVTPPAPPGTPAWAYLTAVLTERGRREGNRLAVRSQRSHPVPHQPDRPPGTSAASPTWPSSRSEPSTTSHPRYRSDPPAPPPTRAGPPAPPDGSPGRPPDGGDGGGFAPPA
ncbi:MAG TPA: RDD family protein [Jiangellaceae bacterium]|nr:RDD family protein [Jiangellaceae bacterium]